jgi:hypothetical protein
MFYACAKVFFFSQLKHYNQNYLVNSAWLLEATYSKKSCTMK